MKRLLSIIVMGCAAITGSAQYLSNGDFSSWKKTCGYSYAICDTEEPRQRPGIEPQDWNGSSVNQQVFATVTKELIFNENNAAKMVNGFVGSFGLGSNAPAYITLGTPWAYAKMNIENCDGGTYEGIKFTHKPDSIQGKFKRTDTNNENSYVIAYLWNGTFKSNIGSKNNPNKEMSDVDRAILGKKTPNSTTGALVAYSERAFNTTNNQWVTLTIPFNYIENAGEPTKLNIIISAADYWDRAKIMENTTLYADDIQLVYNSSLSDLKINGKTINGFKKNVYSYEVNDVYTEGCLSAIKDCVGGTCEIAVNGQLATITVKGDDFNENPSNKHVYTVKFANPSVTINTDFTAGFVTGLQDFHLNRNFPAGWNTICLPFATKTSDFGAGVKAQQFSSANENGLNFTAVSTLEAHKPYLIYFPNGFSNTLKYTANVTSTTPAQITNGDWSFIGTYTGLKAGEMTGKYGVMKNEQGTQSIRKAGSGAFIKGTRAYFEYNGTANVNSIKLNLEGETTGIDCIENGQLTVSQFPANVYSLDGRLVKANANNLNGLSKGIYIVNGTKFIVK